MNQPKFYWVLSGLLGLLLWFFGWANTTPVMPTITWEERLLTWDDFREVETIQDDFDAEVYSTLETQWEPKDSLLTILAVMDPNYSGYRKDEIDSTGNEQLLIHEQYHFNITAYCARLLRKELIALGLEKLNKGMLQSRLAKYERKLDSMQLAYDEESNHNLNQDQQRYWELYVDGLLRETAYYDDPNLYHYYQFNPSPTAWYRRAVKTLDGRLHLALPVKEGEAQWGGAYRKEVRGDSTILRYFMNGKPQKDPFFEVEKVVFINTSEGVSEFQYLNADGSCDSTIGFCTLQVHPLEGKDFEVRFLDAQGNPINQKDGYHRITRTYDPQKKHYTSRFYTMKGSPVPHEEGYWSDQMQLNEDGMVTSIAFFDKAGKPTLDTDFAAKMTTTYDRAFFPKIIQRYGKDGELASHLEGTFVDYDFDEQGNLRHFRLFDEDGKPKVDAAGIHHFKYTYDRRHHVTDSRYYNHLDNPIIGMDGFHQEVTVYDEKDRVTFYAKYHPQYVLYFTDDLTGAQVREFVGDSLRYDYNQGGYKTKFDNDLGIGVTINTLDEKGQIIQEAYQGIDGNWAKTLDGITRKDHQYDDRGNLLQTNYYDSLQQPTSIEGTATIIKNTYNDKDQLLQSAYYEDANTLAAITDTPTITNYQYNAKGLVSSIEYLDNNQRPYLVEGVYRKEFLYNRLGKDSLVSLYRGPGQYKTGYCIIKYTYNEYGNKTHELYYNGSGRLTYDEAGICGLNNEYDEQQRVINQYLLGPYGTPQNTIDGYAKIEQRYQKGSNLISTIAYFDANGTKADGPEGCHKEWYEYDEHNVLTRYTRYDSKADKVNDATGVADWLYETFDYGLIKKISLYDAEANLVEDQFGVAEYLYTPSMNGLYYLERQWDANGNMIPLENEETLDEEQTEALDDL